MRNLAYLARPASPPRRDALAGVLQYTDPEVTFSS